MSEDEVIERVLKKRYYAPGETNRKEMFDRVIHAVMANSVPHRSVYNSMMEEGKFLPNSPTLVNAGRNDIHGTLSACFVLPIEDSLEGIDKACVDMGLVHKAFGGTGFSFGNIRPKGSLIKSTGGESCGPVKVLQLLDAKANMVGQGGKREGGNMGVLPVDHPDIIEWISCKKDLKINHFNLSVAVTNEFMDDVINHAEDARYRIWPSNKYSMEIFEEICQNAWERGCPGLIFIDTMNKNRPSNMIRIKATNPCGEQGLGDYESCNLGSINLGKFVYENSGTRYFDHESFEYAVHCGVRFLDNVIDINNYPIPEIKTATLATRNIGLNLMGWADCLIKMGIHYASGEALILIDEIGKTLKLSALDASIDLAASKGAFPMWDTSISTIPRRNFNLTCIAPTGTLSKLAKCTPGIEPVYDWEMEIFTEQGTYYYKYPNMEDVIKYGLEDDTALRIPIEWHIRHQAAWQRWVDAAVSKTINLPSEATVEDVRCAFRQAYREGCKGITIYRDRSKEEQVLSSSRSGSASGSSSASSRGAQERKPHKFTCRPGRLYEVMSGCGKMFIWIDEQSGKQFEAFVVSSGGCAASNEAMGRKLSDEMQRDVSIPDITRPLKKVKCINAMRNPNSEGNSCSDLIGKVIDEDWEIYYAELVVTPEQVLAKMKVIDETFDHCPSCGSKIVMTGGCATGMCMACGWSGCS